MKTMPTAELVRLMGKRVRVVAELRRHRDGRERSWRRHEISTDGWVVGHRVKQVGHVVYGGWDEQTYFAPSGVVPCLLVATDPRRMPIFVPYDGYRVYNGYILEETT